VCAELHQRICGGYSELITVDDGVFDAVQLKELVAVSITRQWERERSVRMTGLAGNAAAVHDKDASHNMSEQHLSNIADTRDRTTINATRTAPQSQVPATRHGALCSPERLNAVLNLLHHGVIITDSGGVIAYMNRRAERITGQSFAAASGRAIAGILRCPDETLHSPRNLNRSEHGRKHTIELGVGAAGRCMVELRVAPLPHDYGEFAGYLYELRDVSETVRRTQQLLHDATHDPLTGLANRRALIERLDQVLQLATDQDEAESILAVLDLDGFKAVNDSRGHMCGDEMLRELAQLLQAKTRKADTAARFGGDEFVILLPGCGMNAARAIMEDIRSAISAHRHLADGVEFSVTVSIGIAGISAEAGSAHAVLRCADNACYRAKECGGDRIVVHEDIVTVESRIASQGCA
jgi:diguanylate cyclase (GGDEF)-like protein/PAS domain S-box-containing protein